jgi:hypothetical protein
MFPKVGRVLQLHSSSSFSVVIVRVVSLSLRVERNMKQIRNNLPLAEL